MEIGWSELLIIGVVALVIIGPKDLPEMFRTLGRFTAKLRSMSREFSRAMEDAARDSGVSDVADDLRKVASPKSMGLEAVKSAADKFEKWDPLKGARPGAAVPSATTGPVGAAAVAAPAATAAATTAAPAPVTTSDLPPAADLPPAPPPAAPQPAAPQPAAPMGPNTAALAEKVTLRKGIAAEAAEKLRATRAADPVPAATPAAAAEPAPKRGRTRTAAPKTDAAAAPAEKPARKPAARKPAAKDAE